MPPANRPQVPHSHEKDAALIMDELVARQRRADSIQSLVASVFVIALLAGILYLIAIFPGFRDSETIVTYNARPPVEDDPVDRPEMSQGVKPKPSSSSSSMARVLAAAVEAPVAVPVPEISVPSAPFGMDDDFTAGFGSGDGDGDGGGGSSFFGRPRHGRRVVYVVDFSESMRSDAEKGGTRLDALKKELTRSIRALKPSMNFNVIFFAQSAWTMTTEGDNPANNGWNGLNESPLVPWHQASDQIKGIFEKKISSMPTGNGTVWYSPLKMAFSMVPPPDTVYLLSDGEPTDLDDTLNRVDEMNTMSVPIDTIALETPGPAARAMLELAQETGGQFTIVFKGKTFSGMAAEKYTTDEAEDL